jgi:cation transport ATPase
MAGSIRRGRIGVDLIAVLAVAGAMAVGELLAAALIAVMLTSGRTLEEWAAERAQRDLHALLARAPRTARRYRGGSLETVPLAGIVPGDLLMVALGDVVPVDGTVAHGPAVLDESALPGEVHPVERPAGDPVRSGVLNAGGPFDLRATTNAEDSTYAGIIRLVAEAERSQAPFVRLADRHAFGFLPADPGRDRCRLDPGRAGSRGGGSGGGHPVPAHPGRTGGPGLGPVRSGPPSFGCTPPRRTRPTLSLGD